MSTYIYIYIYIYICLHHTTILWEKNCYVEGLVVIAICDYCISWSQQLGSEQLSNFKNKNVWCSSCSIRSVKDSLTTGRGLAELLSILHDGRENDIHDRYVKCHEDSEEEEDG